MLNGLFKAIQEISKTFFYLGVMQNSTGDL